jgi:hypothetical protein
MDSTIQQTNTNPLAKHFRQPSVYLTLPSLGKFYPQGSLAGVKELPVYPMTALDEINMRTPDALYNGTSMVNLIKSCIPDIKDPWAVPMTDFDSILISIKMASIGNEIDVSTKCPSCEEENDFTADLGRLLSSIRTPDYDQSLKVNDLEIYFKPLTYKQVSENSLWQVEQQRHILQINSDTSLSDTEKANKLNEIWLEITRATIDVVALGVDTIKTADVVVRDPVQIKEFLHNCPQETYTAVRDKTVALREQSVLQPLNLSCPSCQNKYEQPFVLDQSNFFA